MHWPDILEPVVAVDRQSMGIDVRYAFLSATSTAGIERSVMRFVSARGAERRSQFQNLDD